jgi:O-antigen/teichoic acid export membrane protein
MALNLKRNALLNFAGHAVPLVAALLAVPVLVGALDPARFGFLSIAWVIVGYFGLFDLGLGRALTRVIAERTGTPREAELPALTRTALLLLSAVGVAMGCVLAVLAPWLCSNVLRIPDGLRDEATSALRVLAFCLPFVTLTAALRGVLEAGLRFGWVNALRTPLGMLTFLAPAAVAVVAPDLVALCLALAVLRVIGAVAHWVVCARLYPVLLRHGMPSLNGLSEMFSYGMWLTISNVVGPLMVYFDRFVIGALASVAAVAYYTAPYEVVTRLWLVPAALTGVMFPVFAANHLEDPERTQRIYRKGLLVLTAMMLPLAAVVGAGAGFWLEFWLGAEYAREGVRVAQILCVGVFFNSLAHLPYSLLQAAGRADLTAKLHLAELPLYIAALAWLIPAYGIDGAAVAWTGRCMVDAVLMFLFAHRRPDASGAAGKESQ